MAGRGRRAQWLIALLVATAAAAAPPAPPPKAPATQAAEAADQAELLDYLSEFEDADGGFVDPAELPPGVPEPAHAEDDDDAR
jgi:hypothetical protein